MADVVTGDVKVNIPNGHPNEDDLLLREDDIIGGDTHEEDENEEEDTPGKVGERKPPAGKDDLEGKDDPDKDNDDEELESEEDVKPKIPFDRPSIKAIKTEFPEFFTKFPEMKEAFFREIEFTKLFPTIEEAKESFEDNQAFSSLSDAALSGDPTPILDSIGKTDKKAFDLFAVSFLPALYKNNQETYHTAVTPIFEGLIRQLYKSSDENVRNSAVNVAKFLFGDEHGEEVATGKKTFSKTDQLIQDQDKLKKDNDERVARGFQEAYTYVVSEIDSNLKVLILRDFDPNKVFTKFLRNQLADEVTKRIKKQLESDAAHAAVMGGRWKRAKSNGYNSDEKSKIVSTFLARAKSLIPATSEKVRSLALKKQSESSERRTERLTPGNKETNGGRLSSGKPPAEKKDYRKMTDMEILALD